MLCFVRRNESRIRAARTGPHSGPTFDAGGLIALDCNSRQVIVLLARATELGVPVLVPASALAQVIRNPARQPRLSRLICQADTNLVPLDGSDEIAIGLLLEKTATADIVDAHVVICARRSGHVVITSDPGDIGKIGPELRLSPFKGTAIAARYYYFGSR